MGRRGRRPRRRAAERRRAGDDAPPPAHAAPLPPAPPLRARGEAPDREGAHRPRRVDAPVLRAHERDPGASSPTPTRACRSTSRSAASCRPTARCAARTAEAVTAALEPGLRTRAYVFNTLLLDKAVDDRLRSLPELAGQPQPGQRGQRRVGAGAARGRALELRPAAPLVPPQGRAARRRPAGRLRPHGLGGRRGGHGRVARGQRPRPHLLPRVLARARRPRPALLRRALDRRSRAPEQARRRLLRVHDAQRAPLRDAQLHEPPARRARARPRARPRPARGARDAARAAGAAHPADGERDRVGVRRDARLPAPARRRRHARAPGWPCWPRTSRARSRRSSARRR